MIEYFIWNDWAVAASLTLLLALVAALADHRRRRRANLDRVGFMPWTSLTVLSGVAAFFCAAIALHTG